MKFLMFLSILILNTVFAYSQISVDSISSTDTTNRFVSDSIKVLSPKVDSIKTLAVDTTKTIPVLAPKVEPIILPVTSDKKKSIFTKPDSLDYTKQFSMQVGYTSILNTNNDSLKFYKSGFTLGIAFTDYFTKYFAYFFTVDYSQYNYHHDQYLEYYRQKFQSTLSKIPDDQKYSASDSRIMEEKNSSIASEYAGRTNNNLKVINAGLGFAIKPVKIGGFTPYLMLGGNILFSLTHVTLIKPIYDTETQMVENERVTFLNNSVDGSISALTALGCEYDINTKMKLMLEVKRTWSDVSRRGQFGYLQWDVLHAKAGFVIKIR